MVRLPLLRSLRSKVRSIRPWPRVPPLTRTHQERFLPVVHQLRKCNTKTSNLAIIVRRKLGPVAFQVLQLPNELLECIASYLDASAVAALSLVCRRLSGALKYALYSKVVIPAHRPEGIYLLWRTLSENRDLARLVSSLGISPCESPYTWLRWDLDGSPFPPGVWGRSPPSYSEANDMLMHKALWNMKNLQHLRLDYIMLGLDEASRMTSVLATSLPSLKSLRIGGKTSDIDVWSTGITAMSQTIDILRLQPRLECLDLAWGYDPALSAADFQPSDLPRLRSLTSNVAIARYLVPGRPVESLTMDGMPRVADADETWEAFSTSTGPLKHVTMNIHCEERLVENLQAMADHLTSLEALNLISVRESNYDVVSCVLGPLYRRSLICVGILSSRTTSLRLPHCAASALHDVIRWLPRWTTGLASGQDSSSEIQT